MTFLRILILFILVFASTGLSQSINTRNIADIPLNSVINNFNSIYQAESLPLSYLPEDLVIDNRHNIYIAERTSLRVVKLDSSNKIVNQLTINDTSLMSSKAAKKLILRENKRPLNLKIAADAEQNIYVLLLNGEYFEKMMKYDKYFNIDKSFILQGPVPGHRVVDFFISPQNKIIIRTFPVAPVGYKQYIKDGLVFSYTIDGTFIERNDPQDTYCNTISELRKKFIEFYKREDIIISETYSFLKTNPAGEIFVYGIKNYGSEKPDRNRKYKSNNIGYKIIQVEGLKY